MTGLAVAFLIAMGAWRQWADAVPNVQIPTPKLPKPNAYDFYVQAGAAIIPANPAVDAVHDTRNFPKEQWKKRYPTANKEAWLQLNAPTLRSLRKGFQYPCVVPPQRSFSSSNVTNAGKFRHMARMLSVESHARSERGDWAGSAGRTLDILRLGHDLSRGGALIDFLVGAAINAIARRDLWEILPHLSAVESKEVARRLEKLHSSRVPFSEILREEKYYGQAGLAEMMRSGQWHAMHIPGNKGLEKLREHWEFWKTPRRVIFRNYSIYMDALIGNAQKPYAARIAEPVTPDDFYTQLIAPVFGRARWNHARDESGNALLLTALALRAYHLEHKFYPRELSHLIPKYLKEIPADPFGAGEKLRYRIAGREYSLYSIGPDKIDNRGRAIEDVKFPKTSRRRFLHQPDSKGDVVAGIVF